MLEGEYIIKNTRFCKPTKQGIGLFIRNIVFITSNNLEENLQALFVEKNINTIRLTDDYKLDNLDFLNNYDFSFIKSIDILSVSITNIDALYGLTDIEEIISNNVKIDYSRFSKIRSIGGELSTFSYKTLSNINTLEFISISNKFKEDDLSIFSNNSNLKYLMLRGSNLINLKGLERFENIESLNLFHNRKIESLEGITEKHKNLKEIYIYTAPKLFFVNDYLKKVINLEILQLECKKVDSFKFLDFLIKLKLLSIHNRLSIVEDGDKFPLLNALKRTNGKIW